MADALIFIALPILGFIAISFALALTLIMVGMLAAGLVGLLMRGTPGVKASIELIVVITGIALAAIDLPAQAMAAGLFSWIYLELLRSDLRKQKTISNQNIIGA